jgi:hypothetical protein
MWPEIEVVSANFQGMLNKIKNDRIHVRSSMRFVHGDIGKRGRCLVGYRRIGFEIEAHQQLPESALSWGPSRIRLLECPREIRRMKVVARWGGK